MPKFKDLVLTELGNTTDGYDWKTSTPGEEYIFNTEQYRYTVEVSRHGPTLQVSFKLNNWDDVEKTQDPYSMKTNEGNQFRIVATVIDITKHVWNNKDSFYRETEDLEYISFAASGLPEDARQREKLYLTFIQRQFPDAEVEEVGVFYRIKPKQ